MAIILPSGGARERGRMIERVWRIDATADEIAQVAAWDARLDEIARERAEISAKRTIVCNRACQRSRYRRECSQSPRTAKQSGKR